MAYFRCGNGNSGGGGQLTETLLWETYQMYQDQGTAVMPLNDSWSNYEYIRIEFSKTGSYSSDSDLIKVTISTEELNNNRYNAALSNGCIPISVTYLYSYNWYTRFCYVLTSNDNQIKYERCYRNGSSSEQASLLKIYRIYGLK